MCKINKEVIRKAVKESGMPMSVISRKMGKSDSYLSMVLVNGELPDAMVERLCKVIGVDKESLMPKKDIGYNFGTGEGKEKAKARRKYEKRYLSPEETEELLSEYRKVNEEDEIKHISFMVKSAVQSIGKKRYIFIDPTLIHVPVWQRNLDQANVDQIVADYKEDMYDPIKVIFHKGKLYVVDGNHRLVAMVKRGETLVQVELLEASITEAKRIFAGQSSGRKPMSIADMYRAAYDYGDTDFIRLRRVFQEDNGIQINVDETKIYRPIGVITPSRALIRLIRKDELGVDKAIKLIKDLSWNAVDVNVFTMRNFNVIRKLFANYGEEETIKTLKENMSGANVYESELKAINSQAMLYDYIVDRAFKNIPTKAKVA